MKYKIKYDYQTGDSFGSSDETGFLELTWTNLDVAKANLNRIKEHYDQYKLLESYIKRAEPQTVLSENSSKDWFVSEGKKKDQFDEYYSTHCLILYTDDGKQFQLHAPWCGYFEGLHSAEIIVDPSDMKIEF